MSYIVSYVKVRDTETYEAAQLGCKYTVVIPIEPVEMFYAIMRINKKNPNYERVISRWTVCKCRRRTPAEKKEYNRRKQQSKADKQQELRERVEKMEASRDSRGGILTEDSRGGILG
jgi:hypothetical protein